MDVSRTKLGPQEVGLVGFALKVNSDIASYDKAYVLIIPFWFVRLDVRLGFHLVFVVTAKPSCHSGCDKTY